MVQAKTPSHAELDLDRALDPLDVVRLKGKSYDMVRLTALSMRVRARIRWLFERLQELERIPHDKGTEADDVEYADRYREVARVVLPGVPEKVWLKVGDEEAQLIAARFFIKAEMASPQFQAILELARSGQIQATLPTASLGSNGSTAATRNGGSTRRRRS